jgi:tRNA(adenine34) deaminase
MDDEYFMRVALREAIRALTHKWIPVGAVYVRNGKIIAYGRKTGIPHARLDHAELNGCFDALPNRKECEHLEGVTVYTTLEPCLMCMSVLMTARVSGVVYGCEDPYGGGSFLLSDPNLPPRFVGRLPSIKGGVLREESRQLLKQFFLQKPSSGTWSNSDNPLAKLALA